MRFILWASFTVLFEHFTVTAASVRSEIPSLCSYEDLLPAMAHQQSLMDSGESLFQNGPTLKHVPLRDILGSNGMARRADIPALDFLIEHDRSMIPIYIDRMVPFVIKNIPAAHAFSHSQDDFFSQTRSQALLQRVISVMVINGSEHKYYPPMSEPAQPAHGYRKKMTVAEFLHTSSHEQQNQDAPRYYASFKTSALHAQSNPLHNSPPMKQLLEIFGHQLLQVPEHSPEQLHIRAGFRDVKVALHFDIQANFVFQSRGSKQFVLLHPLQGKLINWENNASHPYYRQSTDWPQRSSPEFMQKVHGLAHLLLPGEILHVPSLWWHYVEANDPPPSQMWNTFNQFHVPPQNAKHSMLLLCGLTKDIRKCK